MSREDKKRSNKQWNRGGKGKSRKMDHDSHDYRSEFPRVPAWDDPEYVSKDHYYDEPDDDEWDADEFGDDGEVEDE